MGPDVLVPPAWRLKHVMCRRLVGPFVCPFSHFSSYRSGVNTFRN